MLTCIFYRGTFKEAIASACAGVRFIIRKRSYRAWTIKIYKSLKYWIGQSLLRNDKSSPRTVKSDRRRMPSPSHPHRTVPQNIIYHFILSFLLNDKFNSLSGYDCSSFCCCVLLWAPSRTLVFRSDSDQSDRENWISILDLVPRARARVIDLSGWDTLRLHQ